MSVIDLRSARHANEQLREIRLLDIKASYAALEHCLKTLKINNLPELEDVKKEITKTLKKLENAQEKSN